MAPFPAAANTNGRFSGIAFCYTFDKNANTPVRYSGRMSQSAKPQKSTSPRLSNEEQIPPALKAWLDNVIVPALVKQWLAEGPGGHGVNSGP